MGSPPRETPGISPSDTEADSGSLSKGIREFRIQVIQFMLQAPPQQLSPIAHDPAVSRFGLLLTATDGTDMSFLCSGDPQAGHRMSSLISLVLW